LNHHAADRGSRPQDHKGEKYFQNKYGRPPEELSQVNPALSGERRNRVPSILFRSRFDKRRPSADFSFWRRFSRLPSWKGFAPASGESIDPRWKVLPRWVPGGTPRAALPQSR